MKSLPIFLFFVLVCSFAGCLDATEVVVVQERCESSFSLDKGIVYDIDLWLKNEGSNAENAEVTV